MNKLFSVFLISLSFLFQNNTKAQQYVLNENYDDNTNGWDISNTTEATTKIKNGYYYGDISSGIYWLDRMIKVDIDEDMDWVFESSMTKRSGDVSYGLTWGGDNAGSRYNFVISSDQTYMIHKWKDYKVTFNVSSEKSSAINGDGEPNKLTVKKTGNKLSFYVNDVYLTQTDYEPLFGKYFGYYANSGALKIEVDYLHIYYPAGNNEETTTTGKGKTIFKEDFDDNSNKWYEGSGENWLFKVKNGKYVFERYNTDEKGTNWAKEVGITEDQDFTIESTIDKVSGIQNFGYGLIWGYTDESNFLAFLLSGNGYFAVSKWVDSKETQYYPWTLSSAIHQGNDAVNTLKVVKTGQSYKFYINDTYVGNVDNTLMPGKKVGYIVYKNQRIEIDNLYITANNPSVKIIKEEEPEQDPSLLGDESSLVFHFLKVMKNDASDNTGMMKFISPRYLKTNNLDTKDYTVNYYSLTGFKIKKFDKENGIVQTVIWGDNKTWVHQLNFKVVREDGKLYLYPSKFTDSKYIYPWDESIEHIEK